MIASREARIQESKRCRFLRGQVREIAPKLSLDLHGERFDERAFEIAGDDLGVDVAFSADGGCVAETRGDGLDGAADVALGRGFRVDTVELSEGHSGQDGSGPSTEILRRDIRSGDLAQVRIDIGGGYLSRLAFVVLVLKEVLARKLLARPYDTRDAPVADLKPSFLTRLAARRNHTGQLFGRWTTDAPGQFDTSSYETYAPEVSGSLR